MVSGIEEFENVEWLCLDACELGLQFITDEEIVNEWVAQRMKKTWEEEVLAEREDARVQYITALACVDTILDYEKQWNFNYTNIIALCNIRAFIRRNLNESRKQKNIADYFLQIDRKLHFYEMYN